MEKFRPLPPSPRLRRAGDWRSGLARDSNTWPDSSNHGWTRINADVEGQIPRRCYGERFGMENVRHAAG